MADALKIVGQSNPAAVTLTALYTVPASTSFSGSVIIANRSVATSFRVALSPAGAADALTHYVAYDTAISANQVIQLTGIALATTDVIRVYATLATLTFTAQGVEIT